MSEVNTQTTNTTDNNANANTPDTTKEEEVVAKELLDKATSEVADYKKKWKALLSEQAQKELEAKEKEERMLEIEKENKSLKMNNALVNSGFSEKVIKDIVKSAVEGDADALAKAITDGAKEVTKELRDKIAALELENTEHPANGSNSNNQEITLDVSKMSLDELEKAFKEHPELAEKYK